MTCEENTMNCLTVPEVSSSYISGRNVNDSQDADQALDLPQITNKSNDSNERLSLFTAE